MPSPAQAARDILPEITGVDPVAAIYLGCFLFFLTGFAAGVFTLYFWMRADAPDNGGDDAKPEDDRSSHKSEARSPPYNSQSGNIFFALFGAVALVGVLGAATMTIMRGPVRSMAEVTKRTVAENAMIAAGRLALSAATQQEDGGDCDGDGYIEPVEWNDTSTGPGIPPVGGGFLPSTIGAAQQDPWGTTYGYCAWDHGSAVDDEGCGGASQKRLAGEESEDYVAIAVISAGTNRTFETTCADTPDYLTRVGGSDDIILEYTYGESSAMGLWRLKSGDPNTAEIGARNIEIAGSGGADTAKIGYDADLDMSGVGEFIAIKTDNIYSKTPAGTVGMQSPLRIQSVSGLDAPASGGGGFGVAPGLECDDGEIAKWDSGEWACAEDGGGGGGGGEAEPAKGFLVDGSTTSIPNATSTTVTFSSAPSDNDFTGAWSGNNTFTVPSGDAGWYQVSGQIQLLGDGDPILVLRRNGAAVVYSRDVMNAAFTASLSASTAMYLDESDTVSIAAYQTTGGTVALSEARLSIVKLGGGSLWSANGSKAYYNSGNVGIGTSDPSTNLQVESDTNYSGTTPTFASYGLIVGKVGSGAVGMGRYNGQPTIQGMGTGTSYRLLLNPAAGNVGIGTTNPSSLLTVQNDTGGASVAIVNGESDATGHSQLVLRADTGGTERNWALQSNGGDGTFRINEDSTVSKTRLAITEGGNVGIGTDDPTQVLTVDGSTPIAEIRSGGYLMLRPVANDWDMRLQAVNHRLDIVSGGALGTPIASFLHDGNVGIGTSDPAAPLEIEGTDPTIILDDTNGNNGGILSFRSGGTTRWNFFDYIADGSLYIQGAAGSNLRVTAGSNSWAATSDVRLKKNIETLPVLDRLDGYRAVSFDWKKTGKHDIGVVAQELYKIFPEVVNKGDDGPEPKSDKDGVWSVQYDRIGALALEAVKELKERFDDLANKVAELFRIVGRLQTMSENQATDIGKLKDELATQRTRLDALKADNANLRQAVSPAKKRAAQ